MPKGYLTHRPVKAKTTKTDSRGSGLVTPHPSPLETSPGGSGACDSSADGDQPAQNLGLYDIGSRLGYRVRSSSVCEGSQTARTMRGMASVGMLTRWCGAVER